MVLQSTHLDTMAKGRRVAEIYNFAYHPSNVYGHVVELIREYNVGSEGGVHLDVGCGYGAIAEPLVAATGLTYVGVDGATDGLESLRQRGFETHQIMFGAGASSEPLRLALGDRVLRSISCVDMLEHVVDPREILEAFRAIAGERPVPLITSVPNVAHADVAIKMMFGRFDPTDTGILDRTHITHFTDRVFRDLLRASGWQQVAANDVRFSASDQHWPDDLVGLAPSGSLARLLRQIRERADPFARTNQLVRLSLPRDAAPEAPAQERPERPFLSVLLSSDGRNMEAVRDNLQCLAGQTDSQFEVLLLGYDLDERRHVALLEAIEWHDAPLRDRSRFIPCHEAADEAGALNHGLALANGLYATVIDDHALPLAHWAGSFHRIAVENVGKLLQLSHRNIDDDNLPAPAGERGRELTNSAKPADFIFGLWGEAIPSSCIAFPTALARDQRMSFDPAFPNLLARDFAARGVALCGVESSEIVAVTARSRPAVPEGELARLRGSLETFDYVVPGDGLRRIVEASGGVAPPNPNAQAKNEPFLSVLAAVDPDDLQRFRDLVLCLASQSDTDFELIAAPIGDPGKALEELRRAMRAFPLDIREKVAIVPAAGASEAAALNLSLARAQGRFVSVASRDGLPSSNWTASLRALAGESRRHALKVGVKHDDEAVGAGRDFANMQQQFERDLGPSAAYAFPTALIGELSIHFDDTLAHSFLWDFRVRSLSAAPLLVHPIEAVVALDAGPQPDEAEVARLRAGFDKLSVVLPPGSVRRLETLEAARAEMSGQIQAMASEVAAKNRDNETLYSHVTDIAEQLSTINQENAALYTRVTEVNAQLAVKERENVALYSQVTEVAAQLAAKDRENVSLNSHMTEVAAQLATKQQELAELLESTNALNAAVERKREENAALAKRVDSLVEEIERQRASLASRALEIEGQNDRIAKLSKPRGVKRWVAKLRKLTGASR
jgi:predicted nuclease with TOPRIM domain/SAM-dependent methyltransferase